MKTAIRSSADLRRQLGLPPSAIPDGCEDFPTFVPRPLFRRIRRQDPDDPILRQVLATAEESVEVDGFVADPVGDVQSLSASGLIHKYDGRALVVTTGACAVHCRYCFRREFPYSENSGVTSRYQEALDKIESDTSLTEILLSGGDPLTLTDAILRDLVGRLDAINHLQRLRIHTRLPVVVPDRVTAELIDMLKSSRLTSWIVIHCNHPQELGDDVFSATDRLIDAGIPVLNQSVLLRDVNDSADVLVELSEKLINHRIQPYYLHQLDPVRGAAHFAVTVDEGKRLVEKLQKRLPGYAVPKYVAEFAGKRSKTSL